MHADERQDACEIDALVTGVAAPCSGCLAESIQRSSECAASRGLLAPFAARVAESVIASEARVAQSRDPLIEGRVAHEQALQARAGAACDAEGSHL